MVPDPDLITEFGALAVHHTPTDDGSWDGPAAEANLSNDDGSAEYRKAFAWVDPDKDPDTKAAYKFIHHEVSSDGKVGAANMKACSSGIGVLNGGRGGSKIPADDVKGVYNHLVAHLKDSGVKPEDVPELKLSAYDTEEEFAREIDPLAHEPFSGTHAHAHSAYGQQGGDETHEHEHSHDGDSSHAHSHGAHAGDPSKPFSSPELDALLTSPERAEKIREAALAVVRAEPADRSALIPALEEALTAAGWHWKTWDDGERALVADAGSDIPQIVTNPGGSWHAYLCVEGIRTDDGREIAFGATQFPDLPVSLRYMEADEGGHFGAVTCGRIDTMEMKEVDGITACYATGVFSSDKMGQLAQLAVEEQTQRFVSIDPRDVEGEFIEVQVSTSSSIFDDGDSDYDGWFRMTSFVVGAATIVPIPALQQAVITMADQPLPMAPLATERAAPSIVITASGAPMTWPDVPPAEWFATPPPVVGDSRLVRQPDGKYAVPLTVTEEGRVFGHACYWGQEHTGFPGQKVRPPRSATYAHFQTGERAVLVDEANQDRIAVGKITMGVGHPALSLPPTQVKAHYDGGYGAVQIADVRAVEDDFGIWLSGALCPAYSERNPGGPTPEQVAQFLSLDISPDWRKVAGKLHMLALLAVPVGGFPVARESLVASGLAAMTEEQAAGVARASYDGEEIVAMVAAGRVHRMPLSERVAQLERIMQSDELTELLTEHRRNRARERLAQIVGE